MKTYRALAALLDYPDEALLEALPELAETIESEAIVPSAERARLLAFLGQLQGSDLMTLQEHYIELFDRSRALSLHLFEHIHGESRDRGQAMVELKQIYASKGLELSARELPDYLPVLLEYLSLCKPREAAKLLGETAHVLVMIHAALARRRSYYTNVFAALLAAAGLEAPEEEMEATSPDDTPEALDAAWAETPAFGPRAGAALCGAPSSWQSPSPRPPAGC